MEMELKACPFCGGKAIFVGNRHPRLNRPARNGLCHVICCECEAMLGYDTDYGGQFKSGAEAMDAWNARI